jgi:hypothetical protein
MKNAGLLFAVLLLGLVGGYLSRPLRAVRAQRHDGRVRVRMVENNRTNEEPALGPSVEEVVGFSCVSTAERDRCYVADIAR